jgi:hypothetical protein
MPTHSPTRSTVRQVLLDLRDTLVSLELTAVLLIFSMVLIFAATLDQVNLGVWTVQQKYFRSFIVYLQVGGATVPAFPGGYSVGGLLLANLVAAHAYRFSWTWRKAGIQLTHFGLIVLLVGELLTGLWQEDFFMRLAEGETKNYAESFRDNELVLIDITDAKSDEVVAIPEALLATKTPIQHARLPFRVVPRTYYPNSQLRARTAPGTPPAADGPTAATTGLGEQITAVPQPVTHKPKETNAPAAIVELVGSDGPLGLWLVATELAEPQQFTHAGRTWRIALRVKRAYQPFSITLLKFSHDRYAGTEIPKNFSSRLRLASPDPRDNREVLILMNHPLRHGGLTFYQAGFADNDRVSILQVVRNPSWLFPYIACSLMTLGLVMQFGLHLFGFFRQRAAAALAGAPSGNPPQAGRDAPTAPTLPGRTPTISPAR